MNKDVYKSKYWDYMLEVPFSVGYTIGANLASYFFLFINTKKASDWSMFVRNLVKVHHVLGLP